jgi:hypothetical protein
MKFLFITRLDEKAWLSLSEAERQNLMNQAMPHLRQLIADGKFLDGAPLRPSWEGVTVRLREGQPLVTDGPFAETREQVGGYTLIEARDQEEAIQIAKGFLGKSSPSTIEVRQVVEFKVPAC